MKTVVSIALTLLLIITCGTGVFSESIAETSYNAADNAITISLNTDCATLTKEETENLVYTLYDSYCASAKCDSERISETTFSKYTTLYDSPGAQFDCASIQYNGYEMKYGFQIIGKADANGKYPLYIVLHGGGDAEKDFNDSQWEDMFYYYADSVQNGIYINVRGITDTWNLHFKDESYYLYDRLIEDMILFKNADPNRVYVIGFSAGGDGVYQIAAHMADRFAAANMSSGYPNDVSPLNLANLPILLQAGIRDNAYNRNTMTAEFGSRLDSNAEEFGFGYEHDVYIHVPEGHNYEDNNSEDYAPLILAEPSDFVEMMNEDNELSQLLSDPDLAYADDYDIDELVWKTVYEAGLKTEEVDTNAIRWVSRFSRNPFPEKLVWDLDTRAAQRTVESFYYLKAPVVTKGVLTASYDREENAITVDASEAEGDFSILFNPLMLDLTQPVKLYVDGMAFLVNVAPSKECILSSFEETSDLYRVYAAEISYSELLAYQADNA